MGSLRTSSWQQHSGGRSQRRSCKCKAPAAHSARCCSCTSLEAAAARRRAQQRGIDRRDRAHDLANRRPQITLRRRRLGRAGRLGNLLAQRAQRALTAADGRPGGVR